MKKTAQILNELALENEEVWYFEYQPQGGGKIIGSGRVVYEEIGGRLQILSVANTRKDFWMIENGHLRKSHEVVITLPPFRKVCVEKKMMLGLSKAYLFSSRGHTLLLAENSAITKKIMKDRVKVVG